MSEQDLQQYNKKGTHATALSNLSQSKVKKTVMKKLSQGSVFTNYMHESR